MRKTFYYFLFFFVFLVTIHIVAPPAHAQPFECGFRVECINPTNCLETSGPISIRSDTEKVNFVFDLGTISPDVWNNFPANFFASQFYTHIDRSALCPNTDKTGSLSPNAVVSDVKEKWDGACVALNHLVPGDQPVSHSYYLKYKDNSGTWQDLCVGNYQIVPESYAGTIHITSTNGLYDVDSKWDVVIDNISPDNISFLTFLDNEWLNNDIGGTVIDYWGNLAGSGSNNEASDTPVSFRLKALPAGTYTVSITTTGGRTTIATGTFTVLGRGSPTPIPTIALTATPTLAPGQPTYTPPPPLPELAPLCDQIDPQFQTICRDCIEGRGGTWTAIGCIPNDLGLVIQQYIFPYGTGIAGGASFLYFIYGCFLILTSLGNPEKIAQAKEIIVSAISGLLLIIFSIFLLRVIGVDILQLPGFL